jgi:hypothetical protein
MQLPHWLILSRGLIAVAGLVTDGGYRSPLGSGSDAAHTRSPYRL